MITKAQLRAAAASILADVEQMIRDTQWWNNNRLDAQPMDCEGEILLARLIRRQIAAMDRGDMEGAARLSKAMVTQAEQAEHDHRQEP